MEYKVCSKCGKNLPIDKFYKKGKNSNEYRSYCKSCGNAWQLKYYDENREERVKYQKIYETNKRNKNKKYNIEKTEKEDLDNESKKYFEGSKKVKTTVSKSTVRNKNLAKDYKQYFKSNNKGCMYCEICGEWHNFEEMLEVHHILEISKYQENNKEYSTFEDVILLCPNCHKLIHLLGGIDKVKEFLNLKKVVSN